MKLVCYLLTNAQCYTTYLEILRFQTDCCPYAHRTNYLVRLLDQCLQSLCRSNSAYWRNRCERELFKSRKKYDEDVYAVLMNIVSIL